MPAFAAIEGRWARSLLPPAPWTLRRKRFRTLAAGVRSGANWLKAAAPLNDYGRIAGASLGVFGWDTRGSSRKLCGAANERRITETRLVHRPLMIIP